MRISEALFNEILELVENNISEASIGALSKAAANSRQKRRDEAAAAIKGYRNSLRAYNTDAEKYPEEEPDLYRKLQADDRAAVKAINRKDHAEDLAKLDLPKNSKVNANKLFKAAAKVDDVRDDETVKEIGNHEHNHKKFLKKLDRVMRSTDLKFADPVKSRTNESLTEAIINEVSIGMVKRAAKNSIPTRKEKADKALDDSMSSTYPFRPAEYAVDTKKADAWENAEHRLDRAQQLAKNLPDSKHSGAKLKKAAKRSEEKREQENERAVKALQDKADAHMAKPYEERTDKDYKELAKIQNKWVDKQAREDKAHTLTGKKFRRPERNAEGKHELKEQGFIDRSKEANESVTEAIINEISNEFKSRALSSARQKIKDLQDAEDKAEKTDSLDKMDDAKTNKVIYSHKANPQIDRIENDIINNVSKKKEG